MQDHQSRHKDEAELVLSLYSPPESFMYQRGRWQKILNHNQMITGLDIVFILVFIPYTTALKEHLFLSQITLMQLAVKTIYLSIQMPG